MNLIKAIPFKDWRFWVVVFGLLWIGASIIAALWHFGKGPGLLVVDAVIGVVVYIIARARGKRG